jgi:hypothetical protein
MFAASNTARAFVSHIFVPSPRPLRGFTITSTRRRLSLAVPLASASSSPHASAHRVLASFATAAVAHAVSCVFNRRALLLRVNIPGNPRRRAIAVTASVRASSSSSSSCRR